MASTTSTRLWQVHKAAGRPWPVLDEDPVIDFKIMEAIAVKINVEEEKAHKKAERDNWKKDLAELEQFQ